MATRRREGGNTQYKMNAEQYEKLIGRHEHIEHEGLREELGKKFAKMSHNDSNSHNQSIQINCLHPPQPPPLPQQSGHNQQFRKAAPWPPLSKIQKGVQMSNNSQFQSEIVFGFLEMIHFTNQEIQVVHQVNQLMTQSHCYGLKVRDIGDKYKARYNAATRKFALDHCSWPLQIAMTLCDFHLDHIVDVVYGFDVWASDYEKDSNNTAEDDSSDDYTEEDESSGIEEESEFDSYADAQYYDEDGLDGLDGLGTSEDAPIMMDSKIPDLSDRDALQNLFSSLNMTMDANFEIHMSGDDDNNNNENDDDDEKTENEEKTEDTLPPLPFSETNGANLNILELKYQDLTKQLIEQTFQQNNYDFDDTDAELYAIAQTTEEFYNDKDQ